MGSIYLQPSDYAAYGAPNATVQQVASASTLIDAYLKRPEGMVWSADAGGNPAWMSALSPSITLNAGAAIAPGALVTVPITGPIGVLTVGDVLIADRGNPAAVEALVVTSITLAPPSVIFQSVAYAHVSGSTLDLGMTIKQHRFMPEGRPITNLAFTPVIRLISGQGRYGYGRRGEASRYMVDEFNLLASLSHFGGPPVWEFFPINTTGVDPLSGQVWVPAGVMLAYYSEVNIWYVAGWSYANLPDAIKWACGDLTLILANNFSFGDIKSYQAGGTKIELFSSSIIDADTKYQLAPYRAKLYN